VRPSNLVISMDGSTKETYEEIRVGSNYTKILNCFKTISKFKLKAGSRYPVINVAFVAMRSNISELPDLINLLSDWDINHLNVMFLVVHGKDLMDESLYFHQEMYNEWMEKSVRQAEKTGLSLSFPGYFNISANTGAENDNTDQQSWLRCEAPFHTALIQHDGSVLP